MLHKKTLQINACKVFYAGFSIDQNMQILRKSLEIWNAAESPPAVNGWNLGHLDLTGFRGVFFSLGRKTREPSGPGPDGSHWPMQIPAD